MVTKRYSKENLVFAREEDKNKYLIYSAKTRGIHIVSEKIYQVWKKCNFSLVEEIHKKTKFSEKDITKILLLLKKRNLIKTD